MTSSYALGIIFLIIVSILWTLCSMVVQHLYNDMAFDSPFLIVYIGTSLFSIFLPIRLGYERYGKCLSRRCCCCCKPSGSNVDKVEEGDEENEIVIIPWRNTNNDTAIIASASSSSMQDDAYDCEGDGLVSLSDHNTDVELHPLPRNSSHSDDHRSNKHDSHKHNGIDNYHEQHHQQQQQSTPAAVDHEDDYSFTNDYCIQHYQPSRSHSTLSSDSVQSNLSNGTNGTTTPSSSSHHYLLSHIDHIEMAKQVAPLWFLSNYFYAMSLKWTTIASSTVLASMGSIFAFLFATCSRFGDERVTKGKLLGVVLCFLGGVATTWTDVGSESDTATTTGNIDGMMTDAADYYHDGQEYADAESNNPHRQLSHYLRLLRHRPPMHLPHISDLEEENSSLLILLGDLAGLFSAIGYGAYTVLIRHLCPKDEDRMSMQLLFGYIGLWNMILLLPVAIWVNFSSSSSSMENGSSDYHDPSPQDSSSSEWELSPSTDDTAMDTAAEATTVHTTLTWSIFLFLLLKGLLDNVLSDYLWARAVILTSATVASVGVGLTIPMAFVADWIMGNDDETTGMQAGEVAGAVFVLLGFLFVNVNVFCENNNDDGLDEGGLEVNLDENGG
eukprot:CAMPEP_0183711618 /NCGR_PEP_ID=MMETSP0737-20130205/7091_1 /TAXON_ID=385413 /ORGANISM="Thalassiosira miniscula, Strain CCMP1093" /LENGTH=611 /DNA_ID=CAMNT_0025940175 /DNA_START=152 /DNA_END=1983 /DNA_ORIENTATION=+